MDKSLSNRLKKLFSTQVVVRRVGKDRIKVVDMSRLQSDGAKSKTMYVDRFSGMHTNYQYGYSPNNHTLNFHTSKLMLFTDYEAMDTDPIISSALDIYSDECTTVGPDGDLLNIRTQDENIKKILHNLFYDILNIEYNLWSWVRNLVKYGDFYLYLDIEPSIGIKGVIPVSSYEMRRVENYNPQNPYEVQFLYEGRNKSAFHINKEKFENYEIAHFRLLSDSNFLPYGKSAVEGVRKIFKMLVLMEDAMMIHRIMRAPERRVFFINVGNLAPKDIDAFMEDVKNKGKKTPYINENTGEYNLKFNLQNMLEDYYIPVRGKDNVTKIDTLPGLGNSGFTDDIEYIRNRMMSGLKIPKAFFGYDQDTNGKAIVAAEDIRFSRTIERIQKVIIGELTKIAIVHLYTQGYTNESLIDFELSLNNPSLVYQRQQLDLLNEQINLALTIQELNMFSRQYVYENIFKLSVSEWKEEEEKVIEDLKTKFRHMQLETEGNDPEITGESYGTPHDIAAMQMASKVPPEETIDVDSDLDFEDDDRGRPEEKTTFGSKRDSVNGRDPLGDKDIKNSVEGESDPINTRNRKDDSLKLELFKKLSSDNKIPIKKKMLREVFKAKENKKEESLFDEDRILDL